VAPENHVIPNEVKNLIVLQLVFGEILRSAQYDNVDRCGHQCIRYVM